MVESKICFYIVVFFDLYLPLVAIRVERRAYSSVSKEVYAFFHP